MSRDRSGKKRERIAELINEVITRTDDGALKVDDDEERINKKFVNSDQSVQKSKMQGTRQYTHNGNLPITQTLRPPSTISSP